MAREKFPPTFTRQIRSQSSVEVSGAVAYTPMPALPQTRSSLPVLRHCESTAWRTTVAGSLTSPTSNSAVPPASVTGPACAAPRRRCGQADQLCALARETQRAGSTDTGGSPSEQPDPSVELSRHRIGSLLRSATNVRSGAWDEAVAVAPATNSSLVTNTVAPTRSIVLGCCLAATPPTTIASTTVTPRRTNGIYPAWFRPGSGYTVKISASTMTSDEIGGQDAVEEPREFVSVLGPHVSDQRDVGQQVDRQDAEPGEVTEVAERDLRAPVGPETERPDQRHGRERDNDVVGVLNRRVRPVQHARDDCPPGSARTRPARWHSASRRAPR